MNSVKEKTEEIAILNAYVDGLNADIPADVQAEIDKAIENGDYEMVD